MKDAMKPTDKWCPMARLVMDFGPEVLANRFPSGTRYHDDLRPELYGGGAGR